MADNAQEEQARLRETALSKAAKELGPSYSTADLGAWAARQPLDVQEAIRAGQTKDGQAEFNKGVANARDDAFRNGERLPGVTSSGGYTDIESGDRYGRATGLGEQNVLDIEQATALQPGMPAYTVKAAQDEGPGYDLADRYKEMSDLDALDLAEQEAAINQTRTDKAGINAQKSVLNELTRNYNEGGLNAIDRARMARSRQIRGIQARGQEQAVMADAAEQGRGGGNMSLIGRLMAQQNSQRMTATDDMETQALALARKDSILRDKAGIGHEVQTAQDAIDRFNTEGERDRVKRNIETQNAEATSKASRNEADVTQHNKGVDTRYEADVARSADNTDRRQEGEVINKSAGGGARGHYADTIGGAVLRGGAKDVLAGRLMGIQATKDGAEDAAKAAWGQTILGGAEVVGGGVATALGGGAAGVPIAVDGARRLGSRRA